jgi:2-amino-4-hydroxy-6-hydroxymethyldihydropteridine diphosphokinase
LTKHWSNINLSLGANLASSIGKPEQTLLAAISSLEKRGAVIRARSKLYHTPAFPAGNGPDFINAAANCDVMWSPDRTLEVMHEIENEMGRARTQRWGQRTLDIDLISYEQIVLPDAQTHARWRALPLAQQMTQTPEILILPHPRMQDRAFVLVPLSEVAADWRHPVLGKTVSEMLDALPQGDRDTVQVAQ